VQRRAERSPSLRRTWNRTVPQWQAPRASLISKSGIAISILWTDIRLAWKSAATRQQHGHGPGCGTFGLFLPAKTD
jgi:hypothetical protein